MPVISLETNVLPEDVKAFLGELTEVTQKAFGYPPHLKVVHISFKHVDYLSFQSSFEPAFIMSVQGMNNLSPEKNERYSKAFFDFFEEKLGISSDRGYIGYFDLAPAYIGHKGTTYETLRKK